MTVGGSQRRHTLPAAVLCDMDGTLVDTEGLWWRAAEAVAAGLGHRLGEADVDEVLGRPVAHTTEFLHRLSGGARPRAALAADLDRRFTEFVDDGVTPQPGAVELLDRLHAAGVTLALVSASPRTVVDRVLRTLGGWRFALSVSADDTVRSKPAPDPYLFAVRGLGLGSPGACVAVEDSPTGVASAEAAGCRVLAVPSRLPIPPAQGRLVAPTLEGVSLALLGTLTSG